MSEIGADYKIVIRDADGTIVRVHSGESDSFVKNFQLLLEAGMRDSAVTVKDLSGVNRSCKGFSCITASDPSGVATRHILAGASATPVSASDYSLGSQIANSTLRYEPGLVNPQVPTISDGFVKSQIASRSFTNVTAEKVSVRELGIAVLSSTFNVLILRDAPLSGIEVPAGGGIGVVYTFKTGI